MKVYNEQSNTVLEPDLRQALSYLRSTRNFNSEYYIVRKCQLLNKYLKIFGLKSCLVGLSGGVDSATTIALIHKASAMPNSPIKKIVAVLLPVFSANGATNQDQAINRGKETAREYGIEPTIIDLTKVHSEMKKTVDAAFNVIGVGWASGQLVSYIRTPAFYYITSLLSQIDFPGVYCGTTNRDEGAYLGFFGKASDGMVDIQLISDIHKSEVIEVAKILGVPITVINAVPSGDMYDGRPDEEVFGTTYDFVELYLHYLSLTAIQKKSLTERWTLNAKWQFKSLSERLEKLHNYNKHKYLIAAQSIHLDVYKRGVPGGWT
jgi:NAD+ synthetase